ncbi:MAG: preprotein translocase subunit SecG [Ignavibacteriae bacterium HGW-Ignavibacteriae-1]|jgi:preprotein translocase subunit SecG|nr:MAG: preprotein translocase subunit SecG [Ignavibacteriae bacterium HGW-Ignavibacteriae-1]
MFTVLAIVMIILSVLLILVVLLQPGKGDMITGMGGLGGTFSSMLGSRRTLDLLSKITVGLAASIFVLALVTNKFFVGSGDETTRPVTEGVAVPQSVPSTPVQPALPLPEQPKEAQPQQPQNEENK